MIDLTIKFKSPAEWTIFDLIPLNIKVVPKFEKQFFEQSTEDVDIEDIHEDILSCLNPGEATTPEIFRFLKCLEEQVSYKRVKEYVTEILRIAGYEDIGKVLVTNFTMDFCMCNQNTTTTVDVCLSGKERIYLLVKLISEERNLVYEEPKLIAQAIAAFQYHIKVNNSKFISKDIESITFPAMIIACTKPIFYRITITQQLNQCVIDGNPSSITTTVECFDPFLTEAAQVTNLFARKKLFKALKLFKDYIFTL